jgi:hypothetical protein
MCLDVWLGEAVEASQASDQRGEDEKASGRWEAFLAEERERNRARSRGRREAAEDPMARYNEWVRSSRGIYG